MIWLIALIAYLWIAAGLTLAMKFCEDVDGDAYDFVLMAALWPVAIPMVWVVYLIERIR